MPGGLRLGNKSARREREEERDRTCWATTDSTGRRKILLTKIIVKGVLSLVEIKNL